MKKRWLLNLMMFALVASLVTFVYVRPKTNAQQDEVYELSNYKLSEFNAISVEFPAKVALSLEKVNGYWRISAPQQARADQTSVQRILGIIAAKTKNKIAAGADDLEKFGLNNPVVKLKFFRDKNNVEEFSFGTHNPVTDEQYVAHRNNVYLVSSAYADYASTQLIELVDKAPLKPTEKVSGFDFSHLEQWETARLNVDLLDGKWKVSIATAKPQQNEMNEWSDFSWTHALAKSVEFYSPDRKATYPSFEVKLADGSKVHFDKLQESPDLILARPDEGLQYHFANDVGFTMLNPPINQPN